MNERASERASKRMNERTSKWGRVGVSDWFRECVHEFIGGYKVDFRKFKRCSTFNYCTAIQTNKQGWSKYVLIGISVNCYINNHYHLTVQVSNSLFIPEDHVLRATWHPVETKVEKSIPKALWWPLFVWLKRWIFSRFYIKINNANTFKQII